MEINRVMILFSGCFLIVWSTFKWKIPNVIWNAKLTKVCSVALDVGFLTVKLKKDKKGKIKNLQLGICSIFVILAMIMVCFNLNEIYASIMILAGAMMGISVPFQKMNCD